jgi:hypothetical protein
MTEDRFDRVHPDVQPVLLGPADRLCAQFPTVKRDEVVGALIEAHRSVDLFGLARDEELVMAEKIAIEQIKQRIGESASGSLARLDPEKHPRRAQPVEADID